jgi:hypothetical protein
MAERVFCRDCRYWSQLADNPDGGTCRRNAPIPESASRWPVWPLVQGGEFCGQGRRLQVVDAPKVSKSKLVAKRERVR